MENKTASWYKSAYEKCFSYAYKIENRLCNIIKEKQLTLKFYVNLRDFNYIIESKDEANVKHVILGNVPFFSKGIYLESQHSQNRVNFNSLKNQ